MTALPNYAAHSAIRIALEGTGVRPTAVDDFIADFDANVFKVENVQEHIKAMQEQKPHRFFPTGDSEEGLARQAWLFGNVTKAGEYLKRYGPDAAKIAAERYQNTVVPSKPGVEPESERALREGGEKKNKNPWSNTPENLDPKTGRYNAAAFKRQAELVRMNESAAVGIARSAGAKIGDVRPPRARMA